MRGRSGKISSFLLPFTRQISFRTDSDTQTATSSGEGDVVVSRYTTGFKSSFVIVSTTLQFSSSMRYRSDHTQRAVVRN